MKRSAAAAGNAASFPSYAEPEATRRAGPEDIVISCYENDVPAFIEEELDTLYGNIYSSLAQFRIYTDGSDTSTYIARKGGQITAIYLFRHVGNRVEVMNEVMRVPQDEAANFARWAFATFPQVAAIRFRNVWTDVRELPFPFQRHNAVEDIVLELPSTEEAYFAMLGKGTKRNFKRHLRQLDERVPGWSFRVVEKEAVTRDIVDAVISLNHARMAGKNKHSDIDRVEADRILRLVRETGMVGLVEIDGRICAGTIAFRAGANVFLNVLAHDPKYDAYWLGILCCYRMIGEAIARGAKEFHFLWGEYEYKYMLMGVRRDLDHVLIWRSRFQQWSNAGFALGAWTQGLARRLRTGVHGASKRDNLATRFARGALKRLRKPRKG